MSERILTESHHRTLICYDLIYDSVKVLGALWLSSETGSPKMDLERTVATVLSKNEQLRQENDMLKSMLSIVNENRDLRIRMQSFNNDTQEELTGILSFFSLCH